MANLLHFNFTYLYNKDYYEFFIDRLYMYKWTQKLKFREFAVEINQFAK